MKPTSHSSPDDLRRWDREHVWHAFTQMAEYEPFIIERGEGCYLYDIDGNRYLDGVSSLWCNVHGHNHPRLNAAIIAQLERVAHVTNLGVSNPAAIELARRLVERTPAGLEHVFFSSDGASAVEVALKMAFQYWRQRENPRPEKTSYIAYEHAYHGDTIGSVSVGGVARFHQMFGPLLFEVLRLPSPDCYRLPEGVRADAACGYYLQQLETLLAEHHERVAALIIEPIMQGAAGMITHPPGYLHGVRELTKKYDVLLIADEVAVGFGRTGTLFACDQERVSPDFLCLAKGITGGYLPMSATLTTDSVWRSFLAPFAESKSFFHGHTYGGNPLAAAAALASLEIFDEERTLERLPEKSERLKANLSRLAEHPHVGDIRGRGLIWGIELVQDRATKEPYPWEERRGHRACEEAKRRGVWLRPLGNVIVAMPPLSVTLEQIDALCAAIEAGVEAATES